MRAVVGGRAVRIRSSSGGYGNCLYLLGDDGLLYVHAHLSRLAPSAAAQLPRPTHPLGGDMDARLMEVFPENPPRFEAGEILGWSGESGAGKPHLHFEVRRGDRPLNPWRYGVLPRPRASRLEIRRVQVEPASSDGTLRLLVTAAEEMPDGSSMAPCEISAEIRRAGGAARADSFVATRRILFDAFEYGPDKENGFVYDLARSGYRPTTYTFDLTGPTGGGEVILSGDPLYLADGTYEARVKVVGHGGATARSTFRFTLPLPSSSAFADRAGYLADGENRVAYPAAPRRLPGGSGWVSAVRGLAPGPATSRPATSLSEMDGAGLWIEVPPQASSRLPSGAGIAVRTDSTLAAPREARPYARGRATSWRIEPLHFFPAPVRVTARAGTDDTRAALYRLDERTLSWDWLGAERRGDRITATTRVLSSCAVWIDERPPRLLRAERRGERGRLYYFDELSGLAEVSLRDASGRPIPGRFDPDYDAFVTDSPAPREGEAIWTARDRAGNIAEGVW